jgi:hypothetical protein
MKTIASFAVICLGALMATGCATDGAAYSKTVAPAQPGEVVVNGRYVAVVEQLAKQRGTRVVWVNKPTKRVEPVVAAQ